MAVHVPLARRNLFEDRRRALLALGGVGSGLLLVLLMSAVYAGFTRQETAWVDQLPADVIVSQRGVRTMQMSLSALPTTTAATVAQVPGVAWAEDLRQVTSTVEAPSGQQLVSYVFGIDVATNRAGPQSLAAGRMPAAGEVVLDEGAARQLGVGIGDQLGVFGKKLRISGLSDGLTSIASTSTFLNAADFAALTGPGTNYVLVGAQPGIDPDALAARIAEQVPTVTAQSRAGFAAEEAAFLEDVYAEVIKTMIVLGFVVAMALVALSLSAITSAKLRDYGVVKALGANRVDLVRVVGVQSLWAVTGAFAVAVVLAVGVAALCSVAVPNVELAIEPRMLATTFVGAVVVGAPAALLPLRRVLRLDPATAFRTT